MEKINEKKTAVKNVFEKQNLSAVENESTFDEITQIM